MKTISYLTIDESSNPTCFFSDTSGSIHAGLLNGEFQISCVGATDYLTFFVRERSDGSNHNHTTLVYNVSVDGVDEESNPTVVYKAEKRSINVCLTFSANAV